MKLKIHLLGVPRIEHDGAPVPPPRGNKAWGLLAYLVLGEGSTSRSRLTELLFPEAADPLATLRWSLVELRRALGEPQSLRGDPLAFVPGPGVWIDALALTEGEAPAAGVDPFEGELLEGMHFASAPEFETWVSVQRAWLGGVRQASLREAALDLRASGEHVDATSLARRAVAVDPLDQACQEVLLRCLRSSDGPAAAEAQLSACAALLRRELGLEPGPELALAAGGDDGPGRAAVGDPQLARDQLEAGRVAIDAGAVEPGIECLRLACSEAAAGGDPAVQAACLAELGTALVHALRGRDEEGSAILHEALVAAEEAGQRPIAVAALRELGYVDVQAGRNASAGRWLARALRLSQGDGERAGVLALRGMLLSDRAHYDAALQLLAESVEGAERSGAARQAAFSLSLIGRVHLLRDELAPAAAAVERSLALAADERWQSFLPWPEALAGEIAVREGRYEDAEDRLDHAFKLSCSLADPCWEGAAARATALLHVGLGDLERRGGGWPTRGCGSTASPTRTSGCTVTSSTRAPTWPFTPAIRRRARRPGASRPSPREPGCASSRSGRTPIARSSATAVRSAPRAVSPAPSTTRRSTAAPRERSRLIGIRGSADARAGPAIAWPSCLTPTRDHDVVIYGATGFVGVLTAKYLAEHAPADVRIALGGRSQDQARGDARRARRRLAARRR